MKDADFASRASVAGTLRYCTGFYRGKEWGPIVFFMCDIQASIHLSLIGAPDKARYQNGDGLFLRVFANDLKQTRALQTDATIIGTNNNVASQNCPTERKRWNGVHHRRSTSTAAKL
eukprot:GHVT01096647.1.p2 GENE.GHVT01096647.1~~GHVT01096647.1.p2  ORF type:complete len:117 (-),score=5.13 GHVT01096647.1:280-630(-)